jgi:hypothetical protein
VIEKADGVCGIQISGESYLGTASMQGQRLLTELHLMPFSK